MKLIDREEKFVVLEPGAFPINVPKAKVSMYYDVGSFEGGHKINCVYIISAKSNYL